MEKPIIACMMRVKNEEQWIVDSLKVTSTFADHIVILDDGSTDRTAELCKSFPNVHYYYQNKNLDEVRDRNELLKMTLELKPDWILCLDGDEILEATAGERILKEISKIDPHNPQFTFFNLHILYFWNEKNKYRTENSIYSYFWKTRLFTTWGQKAEQLAYFPTDHGGNFHCDRIPSNLRGIGKNIDVKVKHFGYYEREQRERKLEFYKKNDPNKAKTGYYDHLTSEEGMELSYWVERSIDSYTPFLKSSHYFEHPRNDIVGKIPDEAISILDVGCGRGILGKSLKEKNKERIVCGIELDSLAAESAKQHLDEVLNINIENVNELTFEQKMFDVIICGDVLEHLQNPEGTLRLLSRYLNTDGILITSIPNVRHLSVIQQLLEGRWTYKESGIMDETHVRFFTLKEMKHMLFKCGFEFQEILYSTDPNYVFNITDEQTIFSYDTETFTLKNLNKRDLEDLQAVQYIIKSVKMIPRIVPDKLVSIIIPTYNQLDYTKNCLKSIFENTMENYEVIIVDNHSTDGTVEYLQTVPNITIIENKENRGFGAACNQGIMRANGEYLIFLNNDTLVTHGWDSRLIYAMENNSDLGIIGPITNSAGSFQMIEGVNVSTYEQIKEYGRNIMEENWKQGLHANYVSGFCMLTSRELIDNIGGFDEQFGMGFLEDDDFCLRALLYGYKLWVTKDVYVHHFGSASFKSKNIDTLKLLQQNWNVFINKWGFPDNLELPKERDYDLYKKVKKEIILKDLYVSPKSTVQEKLVSVICIVQEGTEIEKTISSIKKQHYRNLELIILDNQSHCRDQTFLQIDDFSNTIYVDTFGKESESSRLLTGLKLVNGDYIAYIKEGDVYYPNHIEELIDCLEKNENMIAYSSVYTQEQETTSPPFLCFMHSRECLRDMNLHSMLKFPEDKENELFYLPFLRTVAKNRELIKVKKITGESGPYLT